MRCAGTDPILPRRIVGRASNRLPFLPTIACVASAPILPRESIGRKDDAVVTYMRLTYAWRGFCPSGMERISAHVIDHQSKNPIAALTCPRPGTEVW
jgi:hypothetical protein